MRIRTSLLVAAVALSLAACDSAVEQLTEEAAERAAEAAGSGDTEIDIDEEGGLSVETDEGSLQIGAGGDVPEDFPDEIPLPADYTVLNSASFSGEDGQSFQVSMESEGLDVVAYIEDQVVPSLEDAGYEIANQSTTTTDGVNFSSVGAEGDEFQVSVRAAGQQDGAPFVTIQVFPAG